VHGAQAQVLAVRDREVVRVQAEDSRARLACAERASIPDNTVSDVDSAPVPDVPFIAKFRMKKL
jgi:hypothetical protein